MPEQRRVSLARRLMAVVCAVLVSLPFQTPAPVAAVLGSNLASGAAGATCSASSTYSGYPCANAIDASETTLWSAKVRGNGSWLRVNLAGGAATITHFRVMQGSTETHADHAEEFVIEYLDGSGAWVSATTWTGTGGGSSVGSALTNGRPLDAFDIAVSTAFGGAGSYVENFLGQGAAGFVRGLGATGVLSAAQEGVKRVWDQFTSGNSAASLRGGGTGRAHGSK